MYNESVRESVKVMNGSIDGSLYDNRGQRITIRQCIEADHGQIISFMSSLYGEDPSEAVSETHFIRTLQLLQDSDCRGVCHVLCENEELIGYSLLIPYLSNEFGGSVVFVDELYVVPARRRRGIAEAYLRFLKEVRPYDARALMLETTTHNLNAARLYSRVGFSVYKNQHWLMEC